MTQPLGNQIGTAELSRWIRDFARLIGENKDHLTALDAAIGDADHGINMDRGMTAVVSGLDGAAPSNPGDLFKHVGMTLVSSVGGASGPLFGTFFLRMGTSCGDKPSLEAQDLAAALRSGLDGVVARGKAEAGDKTIYDALAPAIAALEYSVQSGQSLGDGLRLASDAAEKGRDATVPMLARKGRASYLGERSVGHQDPGATTVALLFQSAVETLG
jgi:phosphoenolpyruvate---glycerone phosphotransferase subunit DhaL